MCLELESKRLNWKEEWGIQSHPWIWMEMGMHINRFGRARMAGLRNLTCIYPATFPVNYPSLLLGRCDLEGIVR